MKPGGNGPGGCGGGNGGSGAAEFVAVIFGSGPSLTARCEGWSGDVGAGAVGVCHKTGSTVPGLLPQEKSTSSTVPGGQNRRNS